MKFLHVITVLSSSLVSLTAAAPSDTTSNSLLGRAVQSGRATYYQVGQGACGIYNNPGDSVVAISSFWGWDRYPGEHCFKKIRVTAVDYGTVRDFLVVSECPTCGQNDIGKSSLSRRYMIATC